MLIPLLLAAASVVHADSSRTPIRLAGSPVPGHAATDLVYERLPAAPPHPIDAPHVAGLGIGELVRAEQTVTDEIARGAFPGAAVAVGRWSQTVVEHGIGREHWAADARPVDPDRTVYDLASLTKVVATTTAVMLLVEDGRMELDAPVSRYLPAFSGGARDRVTIRHLLAHTSGLPAWANLAGLTPERALARIVATPLTRAPGTKAEYSDVGFVVLFAAAEQAAREPIPELLERRVFGPLGMTSTRYLPGTTCARCAPTAQRNDGSYYRGLVHDPIARALGGVAGNAGLFSTAHDLSLFAGMLANGGHANGVRVLKPETVIRFTQRQPGAATRALGWDTPAAGGSGAAGIKISPQAFGHTGFTGTSLWVDPDRGTWTILLANRTFDPRASNRIQTLRRTVHDWVATAAEVQ